MTTPVKTCPITREPIEHPAWTNCMHEFERAALYDYIVEYNGRNCPVCRREFTASEIQTLASSEAGRVDAAARAALNPRTDAPLCPLTDTPIYTPVTTPCGHTFERTTLLDWLLNNDDCPMCNADLSRQDLEPRRDTVLQRRLQRDLEPLLARLQERENELVRIPRHTPTVRIRSTRPTFASRLFSFASRAFDWIKERIIRIPLVVKRILVGVAAIFTALFLWRHRDR